MGPTLAPPTTVLAPGALAALPSIAVRRAVLRERMAASPARAAHGVAAIVTAAGNGRAGGRESALALATTVAHLRREGAHALLARVRDAAASEGLPVVAALLEDAPAHHAIARLGRLPEVCFPERGMLRPWPPHAWDLWDNRKWGVIRGVLSPASVSLLEHQSPVLIRRVLRRRWLPLRHVLVIASRRPTSEAIALELACHDGWVGRVEVRDAMVMNPFTPTALVLALLPTVSAGRWRHLAAAGDAHPLVAAAAGELLGLRGA